jgi:hypothetical protein
LGRGGKDWDKKKGPAGPLEVLKGFYFEVDSKTIPATGDRLDDASTADFALRNIG